MKPNTLKPNSLKPSASPAFAERIGRTLGWAWRSVLRRERNAGAWLTAQGLPPIVAQALPLLLKLAVLGVAVYAAFWVMLLLGLAFAGAWAVRNDDGSYDEEHRPKWEYGPAGYGLYSYDGFRIDPHDPDDEQD